MRSFVLFLFILLFVASTFFNCSLYGSIAKVPYFGDNFTEYAEQERDVFLLMYIAGGRLLPQNDNIRDKSISLTRRAYKKSFKEAVTPSEPIGPYGSRSTFDLPAALIRILYWFPPVALALIFIVLLLPRPKPSVEDEDQLDSDY